MKSDVLFWKLSAWTLLLAERPQHVPGRQCATGVTGKISVSLTRNYFLFIQDTYNIEYNTVLKNIIDVD